MKRNIALTLEAIPVISAVITYTGILAGSGSGIMKTVLEVTVILGFLGFVFFFIGRRLERDDKAVRILGIFDILSTVSVTAIYILAIFAFGL